MDPGELPEAFEGEERTVAGVGDVLQLVSGRQLLGVVHERHDAKLQGDVAQGSDMSLAFKAELLCTFFPPCNPFTAICLSFMSQHTCQGRDIQD